MTDEPTPKEIENLFVEETGFATDDFPAAIFGFARAALAKWGTPQAVAGEPVAWRLRDEEASSTYRKDVYVYYDRADFKENINPIEICDGLECLYSPSQITQTCVIEAAQAPPTYKDSTPELHIGDKPVSRHRTNGGTETFGEPTCNHTNNG